jgi:hypothetical protein
VKGSEGEISLCLKERPVSLRLEVMGDRTSVSVMKEDERDGCSVVAKVRGLRKLECDRPKRH